MVEQTEVATENGRPKTQRALVADAPGGKLEIQEVSIPDPNDDELLVRLHYSGICHSDYHAYLGDFAAFTTFPLIGGHEGAGEVIALGKNVQNWKIGEKVGIKMMNNICMACELCKQGHETNCPFMINYGFGRSGTFQQYLTIRAIDAARIPDCADLATCAPILCAGVTVYRAIKESNVKAGQILALTGAGGGLGSLGIQYAKAMGLRVLAIDHPSKEEHCKKLGADIFQDAFAPDLIESIQKLTNGGPHGAVNVAVAKKPMEDAIYYVRKRGTIVFVGLPKDCKPEIDNLVIVMNCLTIKGSLIGNRQDIDDAIAFVASGAVKVPVEKVSLGDVAKIYEAMEKCAIKSRAVIDYSLP